MWIVLNAVPIATNLLLSLRLATIKTLSDRLRVPAFLVFYKKVGQGSLAFRIKRLHVPGADFEFMNEDEWVRELYQLQEDHKDCCKYATPYNI